MAKLVMTVDDSATMRELMQFTCFLPALVLTAETNPEPKQRGKEVGATGWLVKPFNPKKLLEAVAKLL